MAHAKFYLVACLPCPILGPEQSSRPSDTPSNFGISSRSREQNDRPRAFSLISRNYRASQAPPQQPRATTSQFNFPHVISATRPNSWIPEKHTRSFLCPQRYAALIVSDADMCYIKKRTRKLGARRRDHWAADRRSYR